MTTDFCIYQYNFLIRFNSKVFYIVKVSVHEEANTEPWKHWKFHVLLYLHIYFDCSIASNFPVRFYIQNSLYRWRYYCRDTMNDYFMFYFFISCLVSSGIALIIVVTLYHSSLILRSLSVGALQILNSIGRSNNSLSSFYQAF